MSPSLSESQVRTRSLENVKTAARELERFAVLLVYDAVKPEDVIAAKTIMRLAVGLRRKLESWGGSNGE